MKKKAARFASDSTIYTPHGLGVSYSNANLTDSAARAIIKADPDAKRLFDVLPDEVADDSAPTDNSDNSDKSDSSDTNSDSAAPTGLSESDLDKIADKVADRLRASMKAEPSAPAQPAQPLGVDGQPVAPGADPVAEEVKVDDATTSQPNEETHTEKTDGGPVNVTTGNVVPNAEADQEGDQEGEKPMRLSRMNKDQLTAAHAAEVGEVPEGATNDDLREAIAKAREAKA